MPTKYVRDNKAEAVRETRRLPFEVATHPSRWTSKQRLIVIYAGVLIVAVFLLIGGSFSARNPFLGRSVLRGEGIVVEKVVEGKSDAEPQHFLRIQVSLPNGKDAEDLAAIDAEHWDAFNEGDRVAVLYQVSRNGRKIRIHECGLVALPKKML